MKPLLHWHPFKKKWPLVSFPTYCQNGSISIRCYAFWLKVAGLPSIGFVHINSNHVIIVLYRRHFCVRVSVVWVSVSHVSVYEHSSYNYQRKINETLPNDSQQGYNKVGICCAVSCNNSHRRKPELQFYLISKEFDQRNKWLASIKKDHWQLGLPTSEKENKRHLWFFIGEGMLKYLYCTT